jgi:hypothetical protein
MAKLAYDMSRCANANCALSHNCLRYLDKGHPTYQAVAEFPGGINCSGYIDAAGANAPTVITPITKADIEEAQRRTAERNRAPVGQHTRDYNGWGNRPNWTMGD